MPSGKARSWRPSLQWSRVNTKRLRRLPFRRRTHLNFHRLVVERKVGEEEHEDDEEYASSLSSLLALDVATPLPLLSSQDCRLPEATEAKPPHPSLTILPPPPSSVARPWDRARSMRSEEGKGRKGFALGREEGGGWPLRDGGTVVISSKIRSNGRGKIGYGFDCPTRIIFPFFGNKKLIKKSF